MKNLSLIMKEAHRIASQLEGNYSACLSEGLKQAWKAANSSKLIQDVKKKILLPFDITGRVTQSMAYYAEEIFAYWFKSGIWSEKVANTVIQYKKCSEKQAYCMAKDFVNNMPSDEVSRLLAV